MTRNRLAAVDATSGAATDWNPNANDDVRALAVSGAVIAGGGFTSIGTVPQQEGVAGSSPAEGSGLGP